MHNTYQNPDSHEDAHLPRVQRLRAILIETKRRVEADIADLGSGADAHAPAVGLVVAKGRWGRVKYKFNRHTFPIIGNFEGIVLVQSAMHINLTTNTNQILLYATLSEHIVRFSNEK